MKRRISFLLLLFSCLVFSDCGKKGPLSPPFVRSPQAIQDLSLFQQGNKLFLSWSNPKEYVDGNPIKEISEVEIWLAEQDKKEAGSEKKLTAEAFENKAKLLATLRKDQISSFLRKGAEPTRLSYVYPLEPEKIGRVIVTFSLKTRDEKRRASEFSEPLSLTLQPSPPPPQNVKVSVLEKYIDIRWEGPAEKAGEGVPGKPAGYNVYRSAGRELPVRLNSSPTSGMEYRDENFSLGQTYRYFVRAVAMDVAPFRESEDSGAVEIVARDTFPPAPPTGLTVISGSGFIALSWEVNKEPDLAGYRIWRRAAGEVDFAPLKSLPATENSYSDSLVEKNLRYDYAITALDNAGNESQKSQPASGIIRDTP
jgi:fibronectin type 3 domain-containing protein